MFADLEESFGDYNSTKLVYDRIIDLKIATPQIILNFALFLEENQYFEESFKAYERGVELFDWPHVFDIWQTYLVKVIFNITFQILVFSQKNYPSETKHESKSS